MSLATLYPHQSVSNPARSDFYVYVIFRVTGEPCYVGKGCGRRLLKHRVATHSAHLKSIFAKSGGFLPIVKIRENLIEADALATEKALIAAIGRECFGGPLVNLTDGGEGISGFRFSAEDRARMSEQRRANAYWRGKTLPQEACDKIRQARLGSQASDDTRLKMRAAQVGRKHSEETKAKMSASQTGEKHAMFGKKHREESKRQISETFRRKRIERNGPLLFEELAQ